MHTNHSVKVWAHFIVSLMRKLWKCIQMFYVNSKVGNTSWLWSIKICNTFHIFWKKCQTELFPRLIGSITSHQVKFVAYKSVILESSVTLQWYYSFISVRFVFRLLLLLFFTFFFYIKTLGLLGVLLLTWTPAGGQGTPDPRLFTYLFLIASCISMSVGLFI